MCTRCRSIAAIRDLLSNQIHYAVLIINLLPQPAGPFMGFYRNRATTPALALGADPLHCNAQRDRLTVDQGVSLLTAGFKRS